MLEVFGAQGLGFGARGVETAMGGACTACDQAQARSVPAGRHLQAAPLPGFWPQAPHAQSLPGVQVQCSISGHPCSCPPHLMPGCPDNSRAHGQAPWPPAVTPVMPPSHGVCLQAAGKTQNTPLMDATHYGWATMTLLAQLSPGASNLPSAFLTQAEAYLGQWICAGRVRHCSRAGVQGLSSRVGAWGRLHSL